MTLEGRRTTEADDRLPPGWTSSQTSTRPTQSCLKFWMDLSSRPKTWVRRCSWTSPPSPPPGQPTWTTPWIPSPTPPGRPPWAAPWTPSSPPPCQQPWTTPWTSPFPPPCPQPWGHSPPPRLPPTPGLRWKGTDSAGVWRCSILRPVSPRWPVQAVWWHRFASWWWSSWFQPPLDSCAQRDRKQAGRQVNECEGRARRASGGMTPVSVHTCSEIDVPKQTRVLQYLQKVIWKSDISYVKHSKKDPRSGIRQSSKVTISYFSLFSFYPALSSFLIPPYTFQPDNHKIINFKSIEENLLFEILNFYEIKSIKYTPCL